MTPCLRVNAMLVALFAVILMLPGCRWLNDDKGLFQDRRDDYLTAEPGKAELVIPEDLDAHAIRDGWPIPEIENRPLAKTFPRRAPLPTAIFGADEAEAIKIQKLGERRWMVAADRPDEVWPVVKQFLADNGIGVSREVPQDGLIVSDWLEIDDETYRDVVRLVVRDGKKTAGGFFGRDRLLLRIEQGIRRGSTEIHARHVNDLLGGDSGWPEESHIKQIESELLTELATYFAADIVQPSFSKQGSQISTTAKAALFRDPQGYLRMRLNVDFDRAWATVSLALKAAELTITEERRDEAAFDVTVTSEVLGEEEGFIGGLIPFRRGEDAHDVVIRISEDGPGHVVAVQDSTGEPVSVELGEKLLVMLREFAS